MKKSISVPLKFTVLYLCILVTLWILFPVQINNATHKFSQFVYKKVYKYSSRSTLSSSGSGDSATQGTVFSGARTRTYSAPRLFQSGSKEDIQRVFRGAESRIVTDSQLLCENWAVITTIFDATTLIHQVAALSNWCLCVVGDKKGPKKFELKKNTTMRAKRIVLLDEAAQYELQYDSLKTTPWNHFGRKNIGFLYAIQHGAKFIYDADDDNDLVGGEIPLRSMLNRDFRLKRGQSTTTVYNPYHDFQSAHEYSHKRVLVWPRGFPLPQVQDFRTTGTLDSPEFVPGRKIAVIQSLANHDPDVDAIYRLTGPLPISFHKNKPPRALPKGMFTPYNAQATIHTREGLWGTFLPMSVHGRVSDIWRSYIVQRLLWDLNLFVSFCSPFVSQYRNAHNYLADFDAEQDLYVKSSALVEHLIQFKFSTEDLMCRMEELFIDLYEHEYLGIEDIVSMQNWIKDVLSIGYTFPPVRSKGVDAFSPIVKKSTSRIVDGRKEAQGKGSGRVAVCVSGEIRSAMLSTEDPRFPRRHTTKKVLPKYSDITNRTTDTVHNLLYKELEDRGFDVFMHIDTKRGKEWEPKPGDPKGCDLFKPKNESNKMFCEVEREPDKGYPAPDPEHHRWKTFYRPTPTGLVGQLYGMLRCNEMRKQYELRTGLIHEYMIRWRPDNYMLEKFPNIDDLDFGTFQSPRVLYPDKKSCCCGNEDWFGIGRTEYMQAYFDRVLLLSTDIYDLEQRWIAEGYARHVLRIKDSAFLTEEESLKICVMPKEKFL